MVKKELNILVKGAGIVFIGLIVSRLFGYLFRLVVAKIGTEQYGLLSLGLAITGILSTIALVGLHTGVLRYIAYYKSKDEIGKIKGVINFSLKIPFIISIIFSILLFVFAEFISNTFFHNPDLILVLRIMSFYIPFSVISTILLNGLTAIEKIQYEVYIKNIFEKVFVFLFSIIIIYIGYGLLGVAFAYVLTSFLILIFSIYYFRKNFSSILKGVKPSSVSKELLSYSWPLLLTNFIDIIISWTNLLFLGFFKDASQVGIYNVALPTAMLLIVVPRALLSLFIPVVTSLFAQDNNENIKNLYEIMNKWIFIINFPLFLILFFFSEPILRFLFGNSYTSGAIVLSILSFSYFYSTIFHTSTRMLNIIGKNKVIFNAGILVPLFDIVGAAVATGVSIILGGTLVGGLTYKYLKMQPISFKLIKIFISSLTSIFIIYFITKLIFDPVPLWILIPLFILFGVIYLVILIYLRTFDKHDLEVINFVEEKTRIKLSLVKKVLFRED